MSFKKILVANRGEIAVRVMRTCQEMGIGTVAVFSEADDKALHVQVADEAECIGPAASTKSYLVVDRILGAALRFGAEAVHPGYGFLSEQAEFAEACNEAGLVFIGPPPGAMRLMGDKISARRMAAEAGVPVVPGSDGPVSGPQEAADVAESIGYPVMLKASAGGGGKGMRLVQNGDSMAGNFRLASSEAASAFGDPTLYIEKYMENPRHIEIQILADGKGNVVYLGERECSVQRRHQKLIEETPSPVVTPELRSALGEAAEKVALACGYLNAGTVEFMVDADGGFYFLEVNARLQVEHPITELVCGLDLVREQINIADGGELPFRQEDIRPEGAAVECRIYAEDADRGFLPSPGKVTHILWPGGPGIRVDSGIYAGYEVPMHYDPLLAKVCAWAPNRNQAIARMLRALREMRIGGVVTTATFLDRVLSHPRFLSGRYDTNFLEDFSGEPAQHRDYDAAVVAAMAAEAVNSAIDFSGAVKGGRSAGGWKTTGRLAGLFRPR